MYKSYGISLSIKNIYSLSAPFVEGTECLETIFDLKPSYIRFLQSIHPQFPIRTDRLFVRDGFEVAAFSQAFSASSIDDLQQEQMVSADVDEKLYQLNANLVSLALAEIQNVNPKLRKLFDLAIHTVLFCPSGENSEGRSAHGGSSNKCIGLIWLNLKATTSIRDVVEMLIHELTHTLIFIDELTTAHFNYGNLTKRPYWALSSILKRQRPMDKVVHSIIVSMEILHARKTYLPQTNDPVVIHPDSISLAANVRNSIESVLSHPLLDDVCKPRSISFMKTALDQLGAL